jgi:peptidoglycan/LPS O-acetylase OafA/YrhL
MNPVSPFPAMLSLLVAIATAWLLAQKFGAPLTPGRYASLDGLRGYLAIFVFLHHACIWYFYLQTGQWQEPPSSLYNHLGQSSVALFFMITGFLFFSKLLDGRAKEIDWEKIIVSRLFRLVPLYFFTMVLFFGIVAYLSGGMLREPWPLLLSKMQKWLCFTVSGSPSLNGVQNSFTIVAGVTWSLPYEWFFYLALPILAMLLGSRPPFIYIATAVAGIQGLHPQPDRLLPFLGGIAAAYLVRSESFCKFAQSRVAALLCLGAIATVVLFCPTVYEFKASLLLSIAFAMIAGGNSLGGTLVSPAARTLGEMSYSIYLLHGIVLFVTFNFMVGINAAKALEPMIYWLLVVSMMPPLVLLSSVTFKFIERPSIQFGPIALQWLRSRRPTVNSSISLETNRNQESSIR